MPSFMCGVPRGLCQGTFRKVSKGLRSFDDAVKTHGSRLQAFDCYKAYLLQQGYKRIGSREFQKAGEPITVLTKKSHFGARLRSGKEGTRDMPSGQRTGGCIFIT